MKPSILLISAALLGSAVAGFAQANSFEAKELGPTVSKNSPIALSVNYTAMISNAPPGTCGCFLLNGASSEELFHVWRNFAAVAEVSGNRRGQVPQSQQGLSLVTYMAGPRYSIRPVSRLTTYGQFLIGGVHGFDSYFPMNGTQSPGAANALAFAPGGGIEVGVNNWLSVRAVEAEYLMTRLPNSVGDQQHSVRISSGVIFRFSSSHLNR